MLLALPSLLLSGGLFGFVQAATPPTDVEQPGTQPGEVPLLDPPDYCFSCHGGYNTAVEPGHGFYGSMMAYAAKDPIFWATVAIAEQDFDGAGDLCVRCHVGRGWLDGRSSPTDGSAFLNSDATGVSCDLCHSMVDPSGNEYAGVQNAPYVANDGAVPAHGYYGSGMYVLDPTTDKFGPYANAPSNAHLTFQSNFHRSEKMCASCHDVSNPVVGDLAPNNGAMVPLAPGTFSGVPGAPVDLKAAFNNFPWAYGTIERTSSEHEISAFGALPIGGYTSLPANLQQGSVRDAYDAALASTATGDYDDGTPRAFTCETCHMQPRTGKAAKQGYAPIRPDVALHDLTGGNTWAPQVMQYQDQNGGLLLGGALTNNELAGVPDGVARAAYNLTRAAALEVSGDELRVVNLTGHKLITGYPEGRRMWLHVTWRDANGTLVREDGAYGPLQVTHKGAPLVVDTLLDLDDPHGRVYEIAYGMSQDWAAALVGLGWPATLALTYDRTDGSVEHTLGDLAAQPAGTNWHTLHFALNNVTVSDTRIPPYGMPYDAALQRGVLPVPDTQYGAPGPGGVFDYFDAVQLDPPLGAVSAEIELLYQSTSWEYLQFLDLGNDGSVAFLATQGAQLLDAWLATGMAAPEVMASTTWSGGATTAPYCFCDAGPCGNSDPAAGCVNSSGTGAKVTAVGSTSVAADDLGFIAQSLLPNKPALLFVGDNGLAGLPFGDGLRCAGGNVRRLGVRIPDAGGVASWGPGLGAQGGWSAAQTQYFQVWYRDPLVGPCASGFNLSHGVAAYFTL